MSGLFTSFPQVTETEAFCQCVWMDGVLLAAFAREQLEQLGLSRPPRVLRARRRSV